MTADGRRLPVVGGQPPAGPAPAFDRIAIVGLGAVGGSLAIAVRQAWPGALVIGIDTRAVVEAAMRMHAIDVGSDDLSMAGGADLVVLAAGAAENARALPFLGEAVPGGAVVLALGGGGDAGGEATSLPERLPLVIGLPAVDAPAGGLAAADARLFRGRRWTIIPVTAGAGAAARIDALVRAIGGHPSPGASRTPADRESRGIRS